jgi:uncharacterized membrane protein (DUF485 family)
MTVLGFVLIGIGVFIMAFGIRGIVYSWRALQELKRMEEDVERSIADLNALLVERSE